MKIPAGVLCTVMIVGAEAKVTSLTPWTVTTVSLQGGSRAEWCDFLADLIVRDTTRDGKAPFRVGFVEFLVRDWLTAPGGFA